MNEEKRPEHISYKEYQKKLNKKPSDSMAIFVSAFFILLLLFLGIAKQISPEIDVSIGDNSKAENETVGIEKNEVDERLRLLQMEDNTGSKDDEMFASELDEKVVIPERKKVEEEPQEEKVKEVKEVKEEKPIAQAEKEATPKPQETASPAPKAAQAPTVNQPAAATASTSKVVVGRYSTREQAEVAKSIIAESGLNISPFVRNIGGVYTIQVGSYSTREKAQSVVNDLLRNNYPARIISE